MPQAIPMVASMVVGYVASKAATALGAPPIVSAIVGMAAGGFTMSGMSSAASMTTMTGPAPSLTSTGGLQGATTGATTIAPAVTQSSIVAGGDLVTQAAIQPPTTAPITTGAPITTPSPITTAGTNAANTGGGIMDTVSGWGSDIVDGIGKLIPGGGSGDGKGGWFIDDKGQITQAGGLIASTGLSALSGGAQQKATEDAAQAERDRGKQNAADVTNWINSRRAAGQTASDMTQVKNNAFDSTNSQRVMQGNRFANLGLLGATP